MIKKVYVVTTNNEIKAAFTNKKAAQAFIRDNNPCSNIKAIDLFPSYEPAVEVDINKIIGAMKRFLDLRYPGLRIDYIDDNTWAVVHEPDCLRFVYLDFADCRGDNKINKGKPPHFREMFEEVTMEYLTSHDATDVSVEADHLLLNIVNGDRGLVKYHMGVC